MAFWGLVPSCQGRVRPGILNPPLQAWRFEVPVVILVPCYFLSGGVYPEHCAQTPDFQGSKQLTCVNQENTVICHSPP